LRSTAESDCSSVGLGGKLTILPRHPRGPFLGAESIRRAASSTPGSGGTVSFKYDPFGRRVYKSSANGTSIYAYDGDGFNVIEEANASGSAVAQYTHGLNADEPLAMLRGGITSYYQADGLGSITSLSSAARALAQTYTLDSFGNQTASTGSLTNPFRYTGREFDTETSLYYYRARYYDPLPGRFINEDPARFAGAFNFYAYVKNDPADFIDPTGLKCWQSSPWTEIPQMWGPNGPSPYLTIEDGLYWVPTGWTFGGGGVLKIQCICNWIATHTRIRKFYRVPVKEQAQFKCDCPPRTYYEMRERTKEYEVDSPGNEIWPTQKFSKIGATFQLGGRAGAHPFFNSTVICSCFLEPPTP
jgi:RHS repeat-associated protein